MSDDQWIEVRIAHAPEESERLETGLSQLGVAGIWLEDNILRAYVRQPDYASPEFQSALALIIAGYDVELTHHEIENQNWNAQWEASFSPVVVGSFCAIRAHFHAAVPDVKHELVITPKMAFGTGHHETTFMMIQMMENMDFTGARVMDLGTGTGVLGMLAKRLGATTVEAIDNDPVAVESAEENSSGNEVELVIAQGSSESLHGIYDIVLANITADTLRNAMPDIMRTTAAGSQILLSGILLDQQDEFLAWLKSNTGLEANLVMEEGIWTALKLQR